VMSPNERGWFCSQSGSCAWQFCFRFILSLFLNYFYLVISLQLRPMSFYFFYSSTIMILNRYGFFLAVYVRFYRFREIFCRLEVELRAARRVMTLRFGSGICKTLNYLCLHLSWVLSSSFVVN
jgi:hypothetical protein